MEDPYEMYDSLPKRRVIYGKTARAKSTLARNGLSAGGGGSTTEISAASVTASVTSASLSSSPEPSNRSRPLSLAKPKKLPTSSNARAPPARRRVPKEVHSQPLPDSASLPSGLRGDEDIATKKRKLTRTYSERKTEADDPYAIPSSPPRLPSSKRRSPAKDADDSKTQKTARVPKPVVRLTRSETPPPDDIVMKDVTEQPSMPFSAKTSRSLKNLSVSSSNPAKNKQDIPLRLSHGRPTAPQPVAKKNQLPTPTSSAQQPAANAGPRRKRLIDTLAEQAESEHSDDCEDEDEDEEESQEPVPRKVVPRPRPDIEITFRDLSPEPVAVPNQPMRVRRVALDKGPRFTYSQQRTMLAEEDDFLGSGLGAISDVGGSMFNFGGLPKLSAPSKFSFLDEDDETVNTGAVRSLHELRQAGANHRFADEMHDFLDRIGTPSSRTTSLRRGALLELAQKMSDQNFRRQFRNHGDDRNLFQSLGEETDVISGFSLLAIVVTLLAASSSAHILPKLRAQGLAVLIGRLLREAADIVVLAKDKTHNATKNAQKTLATIKDSLLALPIWEPASPKTLAPRMLSMKCLDLMMMQPFDMDNDDEILTPGVIDQLWSILSANMSNEACWEFPSQPESTDFYMTLCLLEPQIINAMIAGHRETWTQQYVPIAVALLDTALRQPLGQFNTVENRVVRFLVNFTNDNGEACRMFYDQGLLQALAKCTCGVFDMVIKSIRENVFPDMMHETLTLMLAGMINLCVHYSPAARNFQDREGAADSLDHLIKVFAEHHTQTENADSMEKSHLNVEIGYLSILLGHLCLSTPTRDRFLAVHPKKSIQPLVDSLNEFITVNVKAAEEEGRPFRALTRLQNLITQLSG